MIMANNSEVDRLEAPRAIPNMITRWNDELALARQIDDNAGTFRDRINPRVIGPYLETIKADRASIARLYKYNQETVGKCMTIISNLNNCDILAKHRGSELTDRMGDLTNFVDPNMFNISINNDIIPIHRVLLTGLRLLGNVVYYDSLLKQISELRQQYTSTNTPPPQQPVPLDKYDFSKYNINGYIQYLERYLGSLKNRLKLPDV